MQKRFIRLNSLEDGYTENDLRRIFEDIEKGEKPKTPKRPKKEFDLLFKMLSYPGQIFSKEQLLDSVWGMTSESGEETVKTHISRLRSKLANIKAFSIIRSKDSDTKLR